MLYLFYGEDQFSLREQVSRVKDENIPEDTRDFNFVRLDAERNNFQIETLLQNADAFPFMSDKRMVVANGVSTKLSKGDSTPPRVVKGKGTARSEIKTLTPREKLLDFLTHVPESTILVLVEQKIGKNEVLYKTAEKYGQVREFIAPKETQLENWVVSHARQQGIKLENAAAALLAAYVGPNLYGLHNELQKLAAYAGQGQPITAQMVREMTPEAQSTSIFNLTDALARRDINGVIRTLNQLRQETNLNSQGFTRQLFAMVAKQIYDLCRVREMATQRKSQGEIASTLGIHPFVVQKSMETVRNFSSERLDYLYHRLTELDYADKSGKGDLTIQLDVLIAEICQR